MNDNQRDPVVYEIGYLIASSINENDLPKEVEKIKKAVSDDGASMISEGAPTLQDLAYTMRVKKVSGAYESFDQAYFGWLKFELDAGKVEALKKRIEAFPSVLRMLLMKTVRENTYLGKDIPGLPATPGLRRNPAEGATLEKKDAAPATVEEMDKSIDEMVKEV